MRNGRWRFRKMSTERSLSPADFTLTPELLSVADRAAKLGLCPECFGRFFGARGHGFTNLQRARLLAEGVHQELPPSTRPCTLCGGAFHRWETWVERALRAGAPYEWHRFACGSRWDPELLAKEETLWHETGTMWAESARTAFNRELGKHIEAATGAIGNPHDPEIVFLADLPVGRVEATVLPAFFRGRYRKLDRTLPQTHWPCRSCRGRGCERCGGTGKTYATSVEELIAEPILRLTQGTASRFHGMGREDIDARMLGSGRPFVLEILRPHRRTIDLPTVREEINRTNAGRVEIGELTLSTADEVVQVKQATPEKSYRIDVIGEASEEKVKEALRLVAGRAIAQRTPARVVHRRSDRVRTRRITAAQLVVATDTGFTLELRAEAGTYVKEWVEGDGGRTEPNLAALLGVPLKVAALDVVEVHDSEG